MPHKLGLRGVAPGVRRGPAPNAKHTNMPWPHGPCNPICMFELGARAHWVSLRRSNRPLERARPRYLPSRDRSTSPGCSSCLEFVRPLVPLEIAARARSAPLHRSTWRPRASNNIEIFWVDVQKPKFPTIVFCFLVFLGLPRMWISCFTPFSGFLRGNIKKV